MGKSNEPASSPYEQQTAAIANALFKQTKAARKGFTTDWANIMQGGTPQFAGTMFSGMRPAVDAQYDTAKGNILANTPEGGGLVESLSNLESERGGQMANMLNQIWMDQINKAYGAAWNAPQQSMSGLGSAGSSYASRYGAEAGRQGGLDQSIIGGISQMGAAGLGNLKCCFNFLEAEGEIYSTVRRYRDQHFRKDRNVSKGYIRSAFVFVPLMQKSRIFKRIIQIIMTRPLKGYAQWYYGENRYGLIFWPFKLFWVNSWRLLGLGVK